FTLCWRLLLVLFSSYIIRVSLFSLCRGCPVLGSSFFPYTTLFRSGLVIFFTSGFSSSKMSNGFVIFQDFFYFFTKGGVNFWYSFSHILVDGALGNAKFFFDDTNGLSCFK